MGLDELGDFEWVEIRESNLNRKEVGFVDWRKGYLRSKLKSESDDL